LQYQDARNLIELHPRLIAVGFQLARDAMLDSLPSRTLLRPALMRAAHQLLDQPLIFEDPLAVDLVPECAREVVLAQADELRGSGASLLRSVFVLRSRFAEDRLRHAVAEGAAQYLVLGAGLETYPWRQPPQNRGLALFWVDHPASAGEVRKRLAARGLAIPSNLTFVDCDLEAGSLSKALCAGGFRHDVATFCSMLGLTQYLRRQAVAATLELLARLPAGSEVVLSFAPPADELDGEDAMEAEQAVARSKALGEPWLYRPSRHALELELERAGWRERQHLAPAEAHQRYFADRTDLLRASAIEQLMVARR
jgi:methyltransferase (TIGR00027 family)